jgi:RND family efflux transporter MFP subunit
MGERMTAVAGLGAILRRSVAAFALAGAISAATPAAAQAPPSGPPPVTVAEPLAKEIVEYNEFTGQFSAVDSVDIRARVSGYLDSVHFRDGQIVAKGDLLFVIDPRPFEASLASAQAAMAQASAKLDLATKQLNRASELRRSDAVSVSTLDERQQEVKVAAAGVEVAKAQVRTAQLELEYTRIIAPIDGRISKREISVGNLISGGSGSGSTLMTNIVSLSPVNFDFDMSEAQYLTYQRASAGGRLRSQRDGEAVVDGRLIDETGWTMKGRLDFLDNRVNRATGTIRARAVFANEKADLTPGQFGRVRLPGTEPYTALLLPDAAVMSDQSMKIVLTVKDDGTVVPKPVRLGPLDNGLRVIRSGVEPTDKVVINGVFRARPGTKVTPEPGKVEPPKGPPGGPPGR